MADEKSTPSTPTQFEPDTEQAPIDLTPAYGDTGGVVRAAPVIPTMSAAPDPGPIDRVWSAIKEGIPAFNDKFEAASHTDTGKLASGETPKMQLITPEAALTESEKKAHPIATGIAETAGGLTSPDNVAIMAATGGFGELPGVAGKVIPKLISLGFSAQSLKGAYDQIPEFKKAMDAGDESEAERIITHIVLDTAVGVAAGAHATKGVGDHIAETAKNAVAGAKEEISTMANAKAPEGSTEAGFAKLGGKELRGPDTFGRTGGKFGQAVDTAHQVMREHGITGAEKVEPEIKGEGPEWDRVHSAVVDGKKVGSVGYHLDPEGVAQIYGSQVSPEMRGKGIGQNLYRAVIEDARKAGASRITSDSTNTTPDANRVWEKLRDKGLPVESITHANGKPGYQIDFDRSAEEPAAPDFSAVGGKAAGEAVAPETPSPNSEVQESSQKYAKAKGMPEIDHTPMDADSGRATEIAKAYDAAEHAPNDPKVKASFDALNTETKAQWDHAVNDLGIKFEPTDKDPYTSAAEMMKDVRDNHRLKIYSGDQVGGDHPGAKIDPETGLSYNVMFRGVHDLFGHAAGGNDFSESGEKSATESHAQMYSADARPAMRSVTEGQTSWYFHNPEVESGQAKPGAFAPQKAALLPEKFETQGRNFSEASPDEYKSALASNPQAASLSDMNPDAKVYQMNENGKAVPVFYSINPDGEIAGVINNSGGAVKGAATDVFKDAATRGGKYLTAWDVKGKLPDLYRKQGFEVITRVPYDEKTYGPPPEELKASWRSSGWKDGQPNPTVVRMEPKSSFASQPGFEHLTKPIYDHLEPDERDYLKGNKTLQHNVMKQYYGIKPSIEETTNAMQAGAALGGWWQRYMDIFHDLAGDGEAAAKTIGPSHAEVLKQWHAAVSGNKSVQDANNLAWHSYADWLDAGKPTDRKSINDIVVKNAAQPEGSGKKGNAAISDTLNKKGKVLSKGLDTNKLFGLVNSPEMRGERPFGGDVYHEDDAKNPLMGPTEGARKIPSMGATVAGKGNLNRLVIDAHIRDFYGRTNSGGPAAQYIADSAHLRQAAEGLGLKGGEGQEQLWGTVLGLKTLLKEGLTPEEASGKLNADVINKIGKDYAEVIANDPEITQPGGILDRLKDKYGIGRGSAGFSAKDRQTRGSDASESQPASSETPVDKTQLAKTAERIRGQISDSKIKKPGAAPAEDEDTAFNFGANATLPSPRPALKTSVRGKAKFTALDLIRGLSALKNPAPK